MDKADFFKCFKPPATDYTLPNGDVVALYELTLEQRGKLHKAAGKDAIEAQALIVCMGCELFSEADIKKVKAMPGTLITDMADAILDISNLGAGDARKNS